MLVIIPIIITILAQFLAWKFNPARLANDLDPDMPVSEASILRGCMAIIYDLRADVISLFAWAVYFSLT